MVAADPALLMPLSLADTVLTLPAGEVTVASPVGFNLSFLTEAAAEVSSVGIYLSTCGYRCRIGLDG